MLKGNCLVGQSGGPTSVINSSLAGVINSAIKNPYIENVYGMRYGIDGVLKEEFIKLDEIFYDEASISLLRKTPASYLGSCRNRLPDSFNEVYNKIFEVFKKYNIKYFFYIGGNDSMDTVSKLSKYAKEIGFDICIMGVPKTIDNDLVITDHTPGFGSAAKFVATAVREIALDATVYDVNSVTIIEIMGRNAGWLTAASALAKTDNLPAPHLIYLPETDFDIDKFIEDIKNVSKTHKNMIIAVSEGIKTKDGKYICEGLDIGPVDAFGHKQLSGTAAVLASVVNKHLGWKVRGMELNLMQRCASHLASKTDNNEAFLAGGKAVQYATEGVTGCMVYFKRADGNDYKIETDYIDVDMVANFVKNVPLEWINDEGNYVTKDCVDYILPLILGEVTIDYKDGVPVYLDR